MPPLPRLAVRVGQGAAIHAVPTKRFASRLAGLSGWRKDGLTLGERGDGDGRPDPGGVVADPKAVSVIGAPLIYGQPLYGAEKAPATLRNAGLREICTELGWR